MQSTRAIHVDDRGVSRNYVADDARLRGDLDSVPYQTSPWREKYPALVSILESTPEIPHGNILTGNAAVACETFARRSGKEETLTGFTIEKNIEVSDPAALAGPARLDFTPRSAELAGFPVVPLSRYGLQPDAYRPVLPARDLELLRTGNTKRKAFDSQQDVNAYAR
ncbi:MAG: hypothetical protein H7067_16070 [Burkholderiales bacterium]|nr:hypothetical protein [Opitutaceae bacterium]